jgi:thiol-disulfide isomerase/thioredoxin
MKKAFVKTVSIQDFENVLNSLIASKESFYAYFYASYDNQGNSWCIDCQKAKPVLEEVSSQSLSSQPGVVLYNFPVEDKVAYKSPDFLYRKNITVNLEKIPTLIYFKEGKELTRMLEDQILDRYDLMKFFNLSKDIKSKF